MTTNNLKNGARINCPTCGNLIVISDNHKYGKQCSWECKFLAEHRDMSDDQIKVALHNEFVKNRH